LPGEDAAPVVAKKNCLSFTEYVEYTYEVGDEVKQCIGFDILGLVRLAVSAQVWGDDVVASFGQFGELVPPGIPQLREAMAKEHEGTGTLLGEMYAQAIGFDKSMGQSVALRFIIGGMSCILFGCHEILLSVGVR